MATHQADVSGGSSLPRSDEHDPSGNTRRNAATSSRPRSAFGAPDLVGLSLAAALEFAHRSALRLGVTVRAEVPGPTGEVVAQFPMPGSPIRRGSRIHVEVAAAADARVSDARRVRDLDYTDHDAASCLDDGRRGGSWGVDALDAPRPAREASAYLDFDHVDTLAHTEARGDRDSVR